MPKAIKRFRFDAQLYEDFKGLASKNGYTVTGALEKFMADAVKFGLVFPSSQNAAAEAESRVMLAWLKEGKYWVNLGGKEETSDGAASIFLKSAIMSHSNRISSSTVISSFAHIVISPLFYGIFECAIFAL